LVERHKLSHAALTMSIAKAKLNAQGCISFWHGEMVANSCGAVTDGSPRREPWVKVEDGKSPGGAAEGLAEILSSFTAPQLIRLENLPRLSPWANLFRRSAANQSVQILRCAIYGLPPIPDFHFSPAPNTISRRFAKPPL
jgi:hypothetical protein